MPARPFLLCASASLLVGCAIPGARPVDHTSAGGSVAAASSPIERRPFVLPPSPSGWGGVGVCYGGERDGQFPGGPSPTREQIREDLRIVAGHWNLLRIYSSIGTAEHACAIIREEKLPLRLMVGAWIAPETRPGQDGKPPTPDTVVAAKNKSEVATAIRLANEYPDVVLAVNIGNEALVDWSDHRVAPSLIIGYLRQARAATRVPVTTCDTELFWKTPESVDVSRECDFLALHAYAMWNKQSLRDSLTWTRDQIRAVHALHPELPIVLTEIGWATRKGKHGVQSTLITVEPNEADQELFFRALRDWATERRQPYFYFEAFDENWKGGPEPDEVEKHWGVFNADRSPKLIFK